MGINGGFQCFTILNKFECVLKKKQTEYISVSMVL